MTATEILSGWGTTNTDIDNGTISGSHLFGDITSGEIIRTAGSLTNMWIIVPTHGSAISTCAIQKDGVDTALDISIGSDATGQFEDASSVTITPGSKYRYLFDANGVSTIIRHARVQAVADSGSTCLYSGWDGTATAQDEVFCIAGFGGGLASSDTNWQQNVHAAGTAHDGFVTVSANTSTATTFSLFLNDSITAISMSIGSSTTGDFEDASTVAIIATDDIVWKFDWATNSTTIAVWNVEFDLSGNDFPLYSQDSGARNTVLTDFISIGGETTDNAAESNIIHQIDGSYTWSKLGYFVVTASSNEKTYISRVNGSAGSQSITGTASTTGYFEDSSGTDSLVADDEICIERTVGAGTDAVNMTHSILTLPTVGGARTTFQTMVNQSALI